MFIDRNRLQFFPYTGVFYYENTVVNEDGSLFDESEDSSEDGSLFDEDEEETTDTDTESTDTETAEEESTTETEEVIVLETECDIQESNKLFNNGTIMSNFTIYFPYERGVDEIPVRRGHLFRCESVEGLPVSGTVIGIFPSQMGGCTAYIKQVDV